MMADAFSMFDFGGRMGLVGVVSWGASFVVLVLALVGSDMWVSGGRLVVGVKYISSVFGRQILGRRRIIYGFGFFCVGLFVYLAFMGLFSIFPYMFCSTAHFSHNFCISIVM